MLQHIQVSMISYVSLSFFECCSLPITFQAITDKEVHLQLVEEDAILLLSKETVKIHENITPSMLVYKGLEIEEQQCVEHFLTWLE